MSCIRMRIPAAAVVLVAALAGTTFAQSAQKVSLQASALGAALSGDEFEGWGTGSGVEAQIRYNPSAFSIGAGFQSTRHSLEGFDDKVSLSGAFLEPRYVIPTKSNSVAPYVSLRFSVLRESGSLEVTQGKVTVAASGLTFNGGGGLLVRLAQRVNLDVGATWGYTNFGELTTKLNGTVVPGFSGIDAGSGTNLVMRVGVAVGLGN